MTNETPVAQPMEDEKPQTQGGLSEAQAVEIKPGDGEALLADGNISAKARAEAFIFQITHHGLDYVNDMTRLILFADKGRGGVADADLKAVIEEMSEGPQYIEKFLQHEGSHLASVTSANGIPRIVMVNPYVAKESFHRGDYVRVSEKGVLLGKSAIFEQAGTIGTIAEFPKNAPGHCIIEDAGLRTLFRIPDVESSASLGELRPKDKVTVSTRYNFVLSKVERQETPNESFVVPVCDIASCTPESVGATHPILKELTSRLFALMDHPDWYDALKISPTVSYLFSGPTGTGKSLHVRLAANILMDRLRERTGSSVSRLVLLDAKSIYDPYFGVTEQKIDSFFNDLSTVAEHPLTDTDGNEFYAPVVVLMDEAEAILRARGDQSGSAHLFDRVLSNLLGRVQSADKEIKSPVMFIAVSNRPDLIDPAAKRRFGMRQAVFGSLNTDQARDVLQRKLSGRKVKGGEKKCVETVMDYLYDESDAATFLKLMAQPKAGQQEQEVFNVERRDLVTGAMLDEAVSYAADQCLLKATQTNRLSGINSDSLIESLGKQYASLAQSTKSSNVHDVLPHLLTETDVITAVEGVV